MRVLVTGSRNYSQIGKLERTLAGLHVSTLVCGDASGADEHAWLWAQHYDVPTERHDADWEAHGKAAGPIRNQAMVDSGADLCLAFGTGKGTRDCIARAERAGIPVVRIS